MMINDLAGYGCSRNQRLIISPGRRGAGRKPKRNKKAWVTGKKIKRGQERNVRPSLPDHLRKEMCRDQNTRVIMMALKTFPLLIRLIVMETGDSLSGKH
jgi:hypothetical protein